MTDSEVSRIESGSNSKANDSDFELLGSEGCKSVWHQLWASEGGQMLQGIEYESLSANLISEHGLLFNYSEKGKLHGTETNWRICVDVVEGAMARNPIKVLCAFYKALMNTRDSGGAAQHARIAERLASLTLGQRRKNDQGLPHGTMESEQPDGATVAVSLKRIHSSSSELAQEGKIVKFKSTINLPPMPIELQVLSSVLLKDKVYVTGVASEKPSKDDTTLQVQVYSLDEAEWSTLPRATIYNARLVVMDGRITLTGGRSVETEQITDVWATWLEREGQWKESQIIRRLDTGVCQYDNLLLVTGGVMDAAEEGKTTVVNTVNVYNCSSEDWTTPQALELPVELRSHHLVVFEEYIYVIGGAFVFPVKCGNGDKQFNGQAWRAQWSDVKTVVKQPFKKMQSVWKPIVAPPVLRPTVVAYKGFLLTIGGVVGEKPQKGIYKFVDEKADWMIVGEMKMGRYRHGVVPGPVESCGITLFVVGGYTQSRPEGDENIEKTASAQIVCL